MHFRRGVALWTAAALGFTPCAARADVAEEIIQKIREEGLQRSQVMQHASYLTDVIGPRLTGSPNMKRANEWTRDKLTSMGLQNAKLEPWGPFGRGWSLQKFSMQMVEPHNMPITAFPKAWSPGVKGRVTGEVVFVSAQTEKDLEKYKGRLRNAIVMTGGVRETRAWFNAPGNRYTDEQLERMASSGGTRPPRPTGPEGGRPGAPQGQGRRPGAAAGGPGAAGGDQDFAARFRQMQQFASARAKFFQQEGVAVLVDNSSRGDGGTLFVQSATALPKDTPAAAPAGGAPAPAPRRTNVWDKDAKALPQVTMSTEQFNRISRMVQQGEKVKIELELQVKFHDNDMMQYNTVAEIPGSDKADEIVMLGAHMDSWHSGTGATDNAAGCAVAMEAVRILQTLNLRPRRTIRIALWSGEEQGLLGSRAYVSQQFATVEGGGFGAGAASRRVTRLPGWEKLSAYFNLDNGTGKIRGIYCQGNSGVKDIFQRWLQPFADLGAKTVTLGNTGSTDHASFDAVGLPGFQFIQDPVEYDTRTHHSNQDVYDRLQEADLKQAAVIMAAFVYQTAMADDKLPRKPLSP